MNRRLPAFLLLSLGVLPGASGGQSILMGALPRALSASTPVTTACSAMVNANPYTTPVMDTTGAGAVVISVGFYSGAGSSSFSVTDNKSNGSATALPVYTANDVGEATLYYVTPTVGSGHRFTITPNAGSPYAGVCVTAVPNVSAVDSGSKSGSGGGGDNCTTGAITLSGSGHTAISSFAFANVPVTNINSGFAIGGSLAGAIGNYIGNAQAYLTTGAGTLNPMWTASGQGDIGACSIVSFH